VEGGTHMAEEEGNVAAVLALGDEGDGLVEERAGAGRQGRAPHQHLPRGQSGVKARDEGEAREAGWMLVTMRRMVRARAARGGGAR
jgi:hypothetical protein